MTTSASLDEKFHAAVKAIQRLPNDGTKVFLFSFGEENSFVFVGTFQPSNEMKLTFYGLYKQATVGPCTEPRPSMIKYAARMKWYVNLSECCCFFFRWKIIRII